MKLAAWARVIAAALALLATPQAGAQAPAARDIVVARQGWIKVGISQGAREMRIKAPEKSRLLGDGRAAATLFNAAEVVARPQGSGVVLQRDGHTYGPFQEARVEPDNPEAGGMFETAAGKWRGRALIINRRGTLTFINEIVIDDYLKGVLPAEIGDAHPEALKAQAITARSEAIIKMMRNHHGAEGFDVCTKVHCQVYKGANVEKPAASRACEETFGLVLMSGGEVVDAVYHNVCGGVTADPRDVWTSSGIPGIEALRDAPSGSIPANERLLRAMLQSRTEPDFCNSSNPGYPQYAIKYYRWTKALTGDELRRIAGVGTVRDIRVTDRRDSGRVRSVLVIGDRGQKTYEKDMPIRQAFGLWSSLFVLNVQRKGQIVDRVEFVGAGNGHGVGLCQQGARVMASRGIPAQQILRHYYPGATVVPLYRP